MEYGHFRKHNVIILQIWGIIIIVILLVANTTSKKSFYEQAYAEIG